MWCGVGGGEVDKKKIYWLPIFINEEKINLA